MPGRWCQKWAWDSPKRGNKKKALRIGWGGTPRDPRITESSRSMRVNGLIRIMKDFLWAQD